MDCLAFCTATAYQIKPLYDAFKTRFRVTAYRNLIHVEVPLERSTADLFYFAYGAVVYWGMSKSAAIDFLSEIKPFEHLPLEEMEVDEFTYIHGSDLKIIEDEIILPNNDVLTKLAMAHGIAQTVKLGSFEDIIQKTFQHTEYIPEKLAKYGRISLSRREIRRKMGELFIERNSINLHVNVLDVPEFFWDYPELEIYYRAITNYLDLEKRGEVLNQRLGVVHELFEMLGNELNHQHSSRLEITIIILIVIEVALSLLHDVFRIL